MSAHFDHDDAAGLGYAGSGDQEVSGGDPHSISEQTWRKGRLPGHFKTIKHVMGLPSFSFSGGSGTRLSATLISVISWRTTSRAARWTSSGRSPSGSPSSAMSALGWDTTSLTLRSLLKFGSETTANVN